MKNGELEVQGSRSTGTVGLSRTPTNYKVSWGDGKTEYVRCGADILLNGLLGDLDGDAQCPVCGNKTQLSVARGKIERLEPREAILHVVEMPAKSGRIWVECESTHIFDKETCFQKWISTYKGKRGLVTSIEDYQNRIVARKSASKKPPEYSPARIEGEAVWRQ